MNRLGRLIVAGIITSGLGLLANQACADSPHLHKVTWKGKKWEYLIEYPKDINHVDPQRFEEIMDTAGQHGWELVEISHESHFYAFYFKRELTAGKLTEHRSRLKAYKAHRASQDAKTVHQILQVRNERMKFQRQYADEVKQLSKELKKEEALQKQMIKLEKQQLKSQQGK